jgi:endonuclease/exonuclease/phosphatase family metal-dependent hydrolase
MEHVFHVVHQSVPQTIGNLVLTKGHIVDSDFVELPAGIERRGVVIARIEIGEVEIAFATTHLSLGHATRTKQIARLAEVLPTDVPLVLTGDFNAGVEELDPLREVLTLVDTPPLTYSSLRPRRTFDHIAWSRHWELDEVATVASMASDHLPLFADLHLRGDV